jgi:hypothetical protein
MIQRRRDGQEEDEGQEGDPDCDRACQAHDKRCGQEAAQAGVDDIARDARVADSHRPPPQLVAVSLLDAPLTSIT